MRGVLGKLTLLLASLLVALLLGEWILRWRLGAVNYLTPRLEAHAVLRHAIVPGTGAHDAWGFRNPKVPERVDIVAVGDSQTYGVSAPADESWPGWLARLAGKSVYNLSLGGYGPPDYRYLLLEYGLALEPEVAIVGFYFGNDLPRAGEVAAGRPSPSVALAASADPRFLGGLRTWLAQHSVLYQATKFGLPALSDFLRFREAAAVDGDAVLLEHPLVKTAFAPEPRFAALDQGRPLNRRGVEATLEVFAEIEASCRAAGVRCLALLLPTKESVYWELARNALPDADSRRVEKVVREEDQVRRQLLRALEARGPEPVDALPALRHAARRARLYPANTDGHPNSAGYRVIAGRVLEQLRAPPAGRPR